MRRNNAEQIGDMIRKFFRQNGLESPLNEYRLVEAWKDVVGPTIARYTSNLYIKNQILYVHLSSSVLRQELMMGRLAFGVVLTGGSASIQHIDELFRRVTGYDVRIATADFGLDEQSRAQIESPAHSAAVALLLKGANQGSCSVTVKPAGVVFPKPPTPPTPPTPSVTTVPPMHSTPGTSTPTPSNVEEQEQAKPADEPNEGKRSSGGKWDWIKGVLNGITDGINNTFDKAGDDEEI